MNTNDLRHLFKGDFMKKQLALALGLSVLATPAAFASKARLLALGESTNGSFFINDNRNIFLNAAEVNNHKDLVTFEFGAGKTTDTDTAPNAEGGVLKAHGNLVYGLHLGRVTSFNETAADVTGVFQPSNALDVFVGGDAGVKWGANLTYASAMDEKFGSGANTSDSEAKSLDLNFGVQAGDISAYVKAGVMGSSENKKVLGTAVAVDLDRKSDFEIGASFKVSEYVAFAQANMNKYEEKEANKDIKNSSYLIGAARTERLNDKTSMFVKLSGSYENSDNEVTATVLKDSETKTITVPVSIGLEHDANSWLALRGSVSQNIWSKVDSDANDKSTVANSTNVNAGATLKFGELSIDGVVGTNNGSGVASTTTAESGTLALDNLMTRASVTYRF
jgi:hypothetical protein